MDIRTAFPGKYLEAADVPHDTVLTIRGLVIEEVGQEKKPRPIVLFNEASKGLCLNKTNANTIASLYGVETDHWVGRQITLYATEVEFQGSMRPCLRVRSTIPAVAVTTPQQHAPTLPPSRPVAQTPEPPEQPQPPRSNGQANLAEILRGAQ